MHDTALLDSFEFVAAESVERWVAAALAEAEALRTHDDSLYPSTSDPRQMATARRLHQAWRGWADDADLLFSRAKSCGPQSIADIDKLAYQIARARAMLKMTPEVALTRLKQVRSGDVVTFEEARRALRDRR